MLQATKNKYTVETLKPLNILYDHKHWLTQQDVDRVIRIHTMCKDMDEDAFEQMETAAASINLVASLKKLDNRPVA